MADELSLSEIQTILSNYFAEEMGEGACDDISHEILAKVKPIIIREEQKRNAGVLRVLFEKGWTLNDLIEAEDTMEEEYINIVEEAKREERERIMKIFASFGKIQLKKPLSGKEFEALFD